LSFKPVEFDGLKLELLALSCVILRYPALCYSNIQFQFLSELGEQIQADTSRYKQIPVNQSPVPADTSTSQPVKHQSSTSQAPADTSQPADTSRYKHIPAPVNQSSNQTNN